MRRRSWLIRKKQYSTEKVIVGTVKKSIAAMASRLCLPKTPIYVRRLELCLFFLLSRDAHFSSDTPCHRVFDRAFARLCSAIIKNAVRIHSSNMLRGLRYLADFKASWSSGEGQLSSR